MDSVGEGEGGEIWENGIKTCIISYVKRIASPGLMQDTGSLGLVLHYHFTARYIRIVPLAWNPRGKIGAGALTQEPWKQASWTLDVGGFQNQCWASLLRNSTVKRGLPRWR